MAKTRTEIQGSIDLQGGFGGLAITVQAHFESTTHVFLLAEARVHLLLATHPIIAFIALSSFSCFVVFG